MLGSPDSSLGGVGTVVLDQATRAGTQAGAACGRGNGEIREPLSDVGRATLEACCRCWSCCCCLCCCCCCLLSCCGEACCRRLSRGEMALRVGRGPAPTDCWACICSNGPAACSKIKWPREDGSVASDNAGDERHAAGHADAVLRLRVDPAASAAAEETGGALAPAPAPAALPTPRRTGKKWPCLSPVGALAGSSVSTSAVLKPSTSL
mmetsp:Transcript_97061/g.274310  ORF Transcript_97061/g.274310 Transcript_97061/m.274310 type:complete len:208 (-) Transcript_97061:162-785(-)